MSKRFWIMAAALVVVVGLAFKQSGAQMAGEAGGTPAAMSNYTGASDASQRIAADTSFFSVVFSSGFIGVLIWLALLASSIAATALAVDGFIRIQEDKISPPLLIARVQQAMAAGDLEMALQACREIPSPFANILATGFNNIREGFDIIQDAVSVAADIETERLMQRVLYINAQVSIAPMLGLLGTVQGMILAFHSLATMQAGAAQQAMLALNISQALWTTAAGLIIALPALAIFTMLKNKATKIILNMEAMTLEMTKVLKHVEVVEE